MVDIDKVVVDADIAHRRWLQWAAGKAPDKLPMAQYAMGLDCSLIQVLAALEQSQKELKAANGYAKQARAENKKVYGLLKDEAERVKELEGTLTNVLAFGRNWAPGVKSPFGAQIGKLISEVKAALSPKDGE